MQSFFVSVCLYIRCAARKQSRNRVCEEQLIDKTTIFKQIHLHTGFVG